MNVSWPFLCLKLERGGTAAIGSVAELVNVIS